MTETPTGFSSGERVEDYSFMTRPERVFAVKAARHAHKVQGRGDMTLAAGYMAVASLWVAGSCVLSLVFFGMALLGQHGETKWLGAAVCLAFAVALLRYWQFRRAIADERRARPGAVWHEK